MSPGSKFVQRRGRHGTPRVCVPPPPIVPIPPPPGCECSFDPDEWESYPDEQHYFDYYMCCVGQGETEATTELTCTHGWWTDPTHQQMNCTSLWTLEWNSGGLPGNCILTATTTFPDTTQCIATATVEIKEEPP